jgi:Ca2+-binding EF-hand superfamily protein
MEELSKNFMLDDPEQSKNLEEIMKEVDINNDGMLSFEEFNNAITQKLLIKNVIKNGVKSFPSD